MTNYLKFDLKRVGKKPGQGSGGWREGNFVVAPGGKMVNVLRIDDAGVDRADILSLSDDGKKIDFDDENWGLIDFPGGRTKFTIRFDPVSKRYWSLTNEAEGSGCGSKRFDVDLLARLEKLDGELRGLATSGPEEHRVSIR